jgi:DNA-3-methyladenine glycosylase II
MQFSQRKAEYLLGLSRLISHGDISLDRLNDISYDDAVKKLTSIRGLGEWSANYILMRGIGHTDCLPIGDSGLTRAVRMFYGLKNNPDDIKIFNLAQKYRPYRSLFTLYLWFYLMEDKDQ